MQVESAGMRLKIARPAAWVSRHDNNIRLIIPDPWSAQRHAQERTVC
jgi:tRNA G46 methylase TrmB